MRRVKLLTPRVLATGQTQEFGEVIEVEAAEAARLIAAGQALAEDAKPSWNVTKSQHSRR